MPDPQALIKELSNALWDLGVHEHRPIPDTGKCCVCQRRKGHALHDTPTVIAKRLEGKSDG